MTKAEQIAAEALAEWARGAGLYPETDSFPDGTGGGGRRTWEAIAKLACDRATREGTCTWAHVLDEEAAEALAETDPVKLRAELIQVAAVALHWASNLDRRGASPGDGNPITLCGICRKPQFKCPGGTSCPDGHGGAPSVDENP